ncbi:hypothetical protein COD79_26635 [Bacillus cereus]|uniref:exosporium leader peptide-containing protein n=1 Tax=Bacillus cereus TaxID=1396 RepID=UPI000BEBA943|nr:hypothetical protein CON14_31640 [Bacillus cereus]PEU01819.1 hypothetical protein CN531_29320 [Bacillus cereus]PFB08245.1 hypothetical protein CN412_31505 [Bacillus cereus]PGV27583.1 hypothetical protein COD79_26635 [Bacillus cereus]
MYNEDWSKNVFPDETLVAPALNPNLIGPTLPPIPSFTFPTGPTGAIGPTGTTELTGSTGVTDPIGSTSTNQVYVASIGSDDISVIDGLTNSVIATISVMLCPFGIEESILKRHQPIKENNVFNITQVIY